MKANLMYLCAALIAAMFSIAAHASTYTISFTGTGLVPTSGSFDYDPVNGFSNFLVYWPQILGTTPFDLTSAANNPIGGGCGTPTAALAFALLEHSLTGCGAGTYEWNAVSVREGGQTLDFSYGPTSTSYAIDIPGNAYCSTCPASVNNYGTWTSSLAGTPTSWNGSSGGTWSTSGNWTAGTPTASTDVFIDNGNPQHSAVTLDIAGQAHNLTIDSDDSLSFNDNTSLVINGSSISNAGNIMLNSGGNNTDLILAGSSTVTLSGSGFLTLGNNPNNRIYSQSNGTLINQGIIQGAGQIGVGQTTLTNSGIIDANVPNTLIVQPGSGGVTNTGTLEATSGGTLDLRGTYANTGGAITASGASSFVELDSATITGGTLTSNSGGVIESINSATLNGVTISTGSTYTLQNATTTALQGTITNNGNIQLNSSINNTDLQISGPVTLAGPGTVTMGNSPFNRIYAPNGTDTLTNQQTIQGAGQLGVNLTTLVNQGTIDANFSGSQLLVQPNGGGLTNSGGILEATNGANLQLVGMFNNAAGTIEALNAATASTVTLSGANIVGGTLTTTGNGLIESVVNGATLNGVTLSTGSNYALPNATITALQGTITNNGTIQLNSGGNNTDLQISGAVTLVGAGTVSMGNNSNNRIYAPNGTDTLTNQQTIQGAGQLGVGLLTLANQSIIDANVSTALIISPNANGVTNTGTIEASRGGTLDLRGLYTNTGGVIEALTGSTAELDGATIKGGTLTSTGTGVMEVINSATLNGLTVSTGTTAKFLNATNALLVGTITNNGTIKVNSGGNNTDLQISGPVTLAGTGSVTLVNNPNNRIYALNGTDVLTNKETIQGAGQLGVGLMGLVNNGTIIANQSNALNVALSGSGFTNNGTLQVNSGDLMHVSGGVFRNFSGNTLTGGSYVVVGTLEIDQLGSSGGEIVNDAAKITLNGASSSFVDAAGKNVLTNLATITSVGGFTVSGSSNFTTAGNFTNNGSLTVGAGSTFDVNGNLTNFSGSKLTGGTYAVSGTLQFNNANIVTNAANITLTGATSQIVDQTGANGLANFATNAVASSFALAGSRNFTTAGNFTNNGSLTVGAGSTFDVNGNLTNFSGSTLTGGTYNVSGTLQFNNANIVTNAANITLSGASSAIVNQTAGNALANFATNAAASSFALAGSRNFTTAGDFTNNGSLTVGAGSTFDVNGNLTNFSGSTLTGGTYNVSGTLQFNNDNIVTNAANITLTGATSQIVDQTGANGLANFATNAAASSFALAGSRNFTTAGDFTNNGSLTVGAGSKFDVNGSLTNFSGSTLTGGTYNVSGTLQFNNANIVTNAANITLSGASSAIVNQTAGNALANFATNAAGGSLTLAGNRSFTTAGSFGDAGTVKVSKGSTLTVGNNGNYTQSGGKTTVDGALAVTSPGTIQFNTGSVFGNGGTFIGNVTSSAMFNIGDVAKQAGTLAITGNYTQASAGALNIDIGGTTAKTTHDQFNISGAASLGGTLNLDVINGFTPALGSTFDIMNFASETGTFATVTGTHINANEHFSVLVNLTNVTLDVVAGPIVLNPASANGSLGASPTPEPGTFLLLGSGVLGIAYSIRRRWQK